jgi:hypothetical protein
VVAHDESETEDFRLGLIRAETVLLHLAAVLTEGSRPEPLKCGSCRTAMRLAGPVVAAELRRVAETRGSNEVSECAAEWELASAGPCCSA